MKIYVGKPFQQLILYDNTQIPSWFYNPFFSDDGSFSFEATIPSEGNEHIYNYPSSPASLNKITDELPAKINLEGRIINCSCQITSADAKDISIRFFFEESMFYKKIKNKKLTDLVFEDFDIECPDYATAQFSESEGYTVPGVFDTDDWELEDIGYWADNLKVHRDPDDIFIKFTDPETNLERLGIDVNKFLNNGNFTGPAGICVYVDSSYNHADNWRTIALFIEIRNSSDLSDVHYFTVVSDLLVSDKFIFIPFTYDGSSSEVFNAMSENDIISFSIRQCANYKNILYPYSNFFLDCPAYFINHFHITVVKTFPFLSHETFPGKLEFFPSNISHLKELSMLQDTDKPSFINYFPRVWYTPESKYLHRYYWFSRTLHGAPIPGIKTSKFNILMPCFYFTYLIDAISEYSGYKLVYPENIPDFDKLFLFGFVSIMNLDYFNNPEQQLYFSSFNPIQLLPAKPIVEFLNAIASLTGTALYVSDVDNTVRFIPFDQKLLQSSYIDVSSDLIKISSKPEEKPKGYFLQYKGHPDEHFKDQYQTLTEVNFKGITQSTPGQLSLVGNKLNDCYLIINSGNVDFDNKYYRWNGLEWVFYSLHPAVEKFYNFNADLVFEYNIGIFPILTDFENEFEMFLPTSTIEIIDMLMSSLEPEKLQNIPLCFSLDRGYVTHESTTYLLANSDKIGPDGEDVSGAFFTFHIDTESGIYQRFLKNKVFFALYRNDKYDILLLPSKDLIFYKDKIQVNGSRFLIENMEFVIGSQGMSPIQIAGRQTD